MAEWIYLNGHMVPAAEARISAFDAGFTHAAGLFETLRAHGGQVFRLQQHLDRMIASAQALELAAVAAIVNQSKLGDSISDLLTANNLQDARLRIVATPGHIPRPGMEEESLQPTLMITASPLQAYPAELYRSGMRVCIAPFRVSTSDPLARHKTLSYLPRLLAMRDAQQRRCQESLWFTTGSQLAEGSVCNVFAVHQGTLLTPPLDTPVLPGIVRKAVIELAGAQGLTVQETAIDIDRLLGASEVFLTGSIMQIMPVTSVEKHVVGSGIPGEITVRLTAQLAELVAKECMR